MASRMDRYSKNELVVEDRTKRNKNLYDEIQNLNTYSNIECVSSIEQSNEIDISKVKDLINNRENYNKQRKLNSIHGNLNIDKKDEKNILEDEPIKNYDINIAINKAKENISDLNTKYRKLDDKQFEQLKSLNIKEKISEDCIDKSNDEKKIDNDSFNEDDIGLLDELKSDTMVGDASSIKKIIEEEKGSIALSDNIELDKSFYTSSFGFKKKDFDELEKMEINHTNKSTIIIILVLFMLVILGIGVYLYLVL